MSLDRHAATTRMTPACLKNACPSYAQTPAQGLAAIRLHSGVPLDRLPWTSLRKPYDISTHNTYSPLRRTTGSYTAPRRPTSTGTVCVSQITDRASAELCADVFMLKFLPTGFLQDSSVLAEAIPDVVALQIAKGLERTATTPRHPLR